MMAAPIHLNHEHEIENEEWGQSIEDSGCERIDGGDENENEEWVQSAEEGVLERTDDDQGCEEHFDEEAWKKLWDGFGPSYFSLSSSNHGDGSWNHVCTPCAGDSDYVDDSTASENEDDRVKSPAEIKYLELPFRTKHYFLKYTQRILEATCLGYARKNLRHFLENPLWKRWNLVWPSIEYGDYRHAYDDWLGEDGIELENWMRFFYQRAPGMPKDLCIFESVARLRNVAVHRDDMGTSTKLTFETLELAMQLPGFMGDEPREKEMADLSEYVLGDGTMDEDVRAGVELRMLTPRLCTSKYQVLERIQTLLEETCFDFAVRKIPDVLTKNGWDCAERVELQRWIKVIEKREVAERYDNDDGDVDVDWTRAIFPGCKSVTLMDLLHNARMHIRNVVAHRIPLSDQELINQVHTAIRTALLQADWQRAFEIEIVAEMWFTNTSRKEVLDRLASAYRNGRIYGVYELRRRLALAVFLAKEQGKEVEEEGEELVVSDTRDVGGELAGRNWPWTWSPSMHECLKRVEEDMVGGE